MAATDADAEVEHVAVSDTLPTAGTGANPASAAVRRQVGKTLSSLSGADDMLYMQLPRRKAGGDALHRRGSHKGEHQHPLFKRFRK